MSTSSSSSSSSASLVTSSRMRLSGTDLASGLDTDSIIQKLVSGTQSRIDKQKQLQQLAEWKQDAYRNITTELQTFQNTYFSYTNSSTNLLSSKFFDLTSISSSSSLVSATGSASNAENMVIQSISSLATKASLSSTQKVSDETIASGVIQGNWVNSTVGGQSLVLNYGGTDYTLTLSSDFYLDSNASDEDMANSLVTELNKQVGATDDLKGKVTFTANDGVLTVASEDSSTIKISADDTDFLTALGFTNGASGTSLTGSAVDTSASGDLFNKTVDAASEIILNVNGVDNAYTLTLGEDYDTSGKDSTTIATEIAALLQTSVDANADLRGNVSVTAVNGKISFQNAAGDSMYIEGGSQNLLDGLGLEQGNEDNASTQINGSGINKTDLVTSYLPDVLSGNSLTFDLNGLSKTISFDKNDLQSGEDFSTASGIATYLNRKLTSAFGSGKVTVTKNDDNTLTFKTGDSSSVLTLTSSDNTNVLGSDGALHINAYETNRTELTKTLYDLSSELNQTLNPDGDGDYKISVNGKDFTFSNTDTLSNIITKINDDTDVNVTISYSQTANTFRIVSDDTGSQGKTDIEDVSGNLVSVLLGTSASRTVTDGTDMKMSICVNGSSDPMDIVRSSNTTTIDGVTLTVNGTTPQDSDGNYINENITLSSDNNTDDLYDKITDFVDAYNKIINDINTMVTDSTDSDYPPLTDSQKKDMSDSEITAWQDKAKAGVLENDSTLSNILRDLRSSMTGYVDSTGTALSQIGISTVALDYTSGGQLTIDTDTLKGALSSNPDKIEEMFTNEDGISQQVNKVLNKYAGTFGGEGTLLSIAGTSSDVVDDSQLGTQITSYKKAVSNLQDDLKTEEERYWDKFTAMEAALSKLVSQSSYLTSMLGTSSS